MNFQHMRIARPVSDLSRSSEMYCEGLGLNKIGEFTDHDGFSGCMLGREDLPRHLEFTQCHHHPVNPSSSPEDLLVLYVPEKEDWESACSEMESAGFIRVESFNPYWERRGVTFEDHDGYRVVIQNMKWGEV
ncbi:VOC family protein [Pantoea cypripedii]|uniref:Prolyl endopeptidase n=1 Tax=Pantoea cypripedii TaxID=55209 RepID=A0A6B9GGE7_PANCY|nr:VOC family protein [Pantoea cypripedii]QGY32625.1 prolyl endopeptidase [Pantoea cypripedii]